MAAQLTRYLQIADDLRRRIESREFTADALLPVRPNCKASTECHARIAARLGIEAGDYVVSRRQERRVNGTVWSVQTTYYPMKWVTQGAAKLLEPVGILDGAVRHIAEVLGHQRVGYRDLVSARPPDSGEQGVFGLTHNHTVMQVDRTSFTAGGTPIRVTVTVFPADRNQVLYDIGTVPDYQEQLA